MADGRPKRKEPEPEAASTEGPSDWIHTAASAFWLVQEMNEQAKLDEERLREDRENAAWVMATLPEFRKKFNLPVRTPEEEAEYTAAALANLDRLRDDDGFDDYLDLLVRPEDRALSKRRAVDDGALRRYH
ncbi:uncharacterized protein LOC107304639 [Oryza brachyantha]|uniref:Uncharacterized protein n=1 Tax=Oryza brachyantha TaxID=4533 RepID=J3MN95_ORYBR|nr:uncharacterized protein LOC107304639 [Oryza brachyantha]